MPEESNIDGEKTHPRQRFFGIAINSLLVISLVALGLVAWLRLPRWIVWAESHSAKSQNQKAEQKQVITGTFEDAQSNSQLASGDTSPVAMAPISNIYTSEMFGVSRNLELDTVIPTRPRVDVITYTVETGDNLFTIAERYNLKRRQSCGATSRLSRIIQICFLQARCLTFFPSTGPTTNGMLAITWQTSLPSLAWT